MTITVAVNFSSCLFFMSSPEAPALANGNAAKVTESNSLKLGMIPKGMPSTVVPCVTEGSLANGLPNGHVMPPLDSPFAGYIIAIHRKMVRTAGWAKDGDKIISASRLVKVYIMLISKQCVISVCFVDAGRVILPVQSEEPPQPVWDAVDCAVYSPHQDQGPV